VEGELGAVDEEDDDDELTMVGVELDEDDR
jgi:hypothetical protein